MSKDAPATPPTADDIHRAIAETATCSEAADRLKITPWELIRYARQYKIKLNWSRDWGR